MALKRVLVEMNATQLGYDWGFAGAVELTTLDVVIAGERVIVEMENYEGITIRGPSALVRRIRDRVVTSSLA